MLSRIEDDGSNERYRTEINTWTPDQTTNNRNKCARAVVMWIHPAWKIQCLVDFKTSKSSMCLTRVKARQRSTGALIDDPQLQSRSGDHVFRFKFAWSDSLYNIKSKSTDCSMSIQLTDLLLAIQGLFEQRNQYYKTQAQVRVGATELLDSLHLPTEIIINGYYTSEYHPCFTR